MTDREIEFFDLGRHLCSLNAMVTFDTFKPELQERANQIKRQITILCDNISSGQLTNLGLIRRFFRDFTEQIVQLRQENRMR
jgi:hypothetical protein